MHIEFDREGNAENNLARLWIDAAQGDRQRITDAAFDIGESPGFWQALFLVVPG